MRVLVVDESAERAEMLRAALLPAGYEVMALSSPLLLLRTIEKLQPDVIVIDIDSPTRDVLEHLAVMTQHAPRPVVMFANDGNKETIRQAVRAGVSAYIVDNLDPPRVKPVIDAAIAYFDEFQDLRRQLSERKLVEKAKGLLMKQRGFDEEAAHAALRKMAMDRSLKLAEVAQRVIDAADILGA